MAATHLFGLDPDGKVVEYVEISSLPSISLGTDVVDNTMLTNMAQATIKGRQAGSGTGDPEDLTAAQARTILNVADGATANSADATLLARANHTGTQLSTTISDFEEAVEDVVGGAIVAGTNMTVTYNDGAGTITLDAAAGVPGADTVTNTILANMVESTIKGRAAGAGTGDPTDLTATQVRTLINVADGSTANSSDATLLARANHTGTQLASTISDFAEAVDDRVAGLLVAGTNILLTYNDGAGTLTIDGTVTVGADSIDNTELTNMAEATLKGREAGAGTGDPQDLTAAQARTLLNVADGATANSSDATLLARANHTGTQLSTTISDFSEAVDDRVAALIVAGTNVTATYDDGLNTLTLSAATGAPTADSVTNTHLANMATQTIKGRNTAGTGDPEDLSAATVRTILNVANGATANSTDATLLARANHTGTQTASTISDFNEALDDRVAALIIAGTGITKTYNDGAGTLTLDASVAASGNFTPVGTGAVVRTQDVKMREVELSVVDYGADPTGVADSTAAFNNCMAQTRRMHVPAGTYRVTNLVIAKSMYIFGDTRMQSRINFTTTSQHAFDIFGTDAESAEGLIVMKNLSLNYTGAGQTAGNHGLVIRRRCILENIMVQDFTNNGVSFERREPTEASTAAFFCQLTRVFSRNNGLDGIYVHDGANANSFLNCDFSNNGRYGWHQDSGYGNMLLGGQASYNGSYGYMHAGGTNATWYWPYAEGNGRVSGTGYVNTYFDFFIDNTSNRSTFYIGTPLNGDAAHIRCPNRGSVESCGVYMGGQRVYGSGTSPAPHNEANAGVQYNIPTRASPVATVGTANATDLASCIALSNQLKTTMNNLLTQLRNGRMIEP